MIAEVLSLRRSGLRFACRQAGSNDDLERLELSLNHLGVGLQLALQSLVTRDGAGVRNAPLPAVMRVIAACIASSLMAIVVRL
ncbi:unnamed protein product [Zymoseptoria tritici ST99CH_3D7]|uniref:Uncharacterized protein n=1 Tax=Zymoseptoria tritici (strain ST99CH_3D7) TaxID=1276538 RepID=A0A1X7RF30_ZYMT9|nr:unnamed protein product [Zymoseptoria tritici ST99CH_3D7]